MKYNDITKNIIAITVIATIITGCSASTDTTTKPVQDAKDVKAKIESEPKCDPEEESGKYIESLDKPVIYLYGYENELPLVTLDFDGAVTMTYPQAEMDEDGAFTWEPKVGKDGLLDFDGHKYRYLFWEGKSDIKWDFDEGYCIKGEDIIEFLDETLPKYGLNDQEIQDFVTYWAPKMQNNDYNVIKFQGSQYTDIAKLDINPEPDSEIRVYMTWYSSKEFVELEEPEVEKVTRKGKTLVEWGGTQVNAKTLVTKGIKVTVSGDEAEESEDKEKEAKKEEKDPYEKYGEYADCARAWDTVAYKRAGMKWEELPRSLKDQALFHYLQDGTKGWE